MADFRELLLKITGDSSSGVDAVNNLAESLRQLAEGVDGQKDKAAAADASWAKLFGTFAGGVTVGNLLSDALEGVVHVVEQAAMALPNMVKHAEDLGAQLYEMSLKTGATVENLSQLRYVAEVTGFGFERLNTTFFMMQRALGQTGAAGDRVTSALQGIGLSAAAIRRQAPDEQFITIVSALEQVTDRSKKAKDAMILFGRGGRDMMGLLSDDIKKLLQDAKDLGITISASDAAAAKAAAVGWKALQMQLEAVENKLAFALMPALVAFEQLAGDAFKALTKSWGDLNTAAGKAQFQATLAKIGETLIMAVAAMAGFAEGSIAGLKTVIEWISKLAEGILTVASVAGTASKYLDLLQGNIGGAMIIDKQKAQIDAMKSAIETFRTGSIATLDVAGKAFETVEHVADNMSGKFKDRLNDVDKTIADYVAKIQHTTQGQVDETEHYNEDIAAKLEAMWDEYYGTIDKAEGDSYGAAMEHIDAWYERTYNSIVKLSKKHQEAWDLLGPLNAEYWAKQVEAQANADAKADALRQSALKLWDEYYQAIEKNQHQTLEASLIGIDTWYDHEFAVIEKEAKTNDAAWEKKGALDAAFWARRQKAIDDDATKQQAYADETSKIWEEYYVTLAGDSGETVEKQIAGVNKWFDSEVKKIKADDAEWNEHYEALEALAKAKTDAIMHAHDEMYQAIKKLNIDLQGDWAKTFQGTLAKTHSFKDAIVGVFKQLMDDLNNVWAGMLTQAIKGFLQPLLSSTAQAASQFGGMFSKALGGGGGGGGGGGLGGFLGGLFGGGGGGDFVGPLEEGATAPAGGGAGGLLGLFGMGGGLAAGAATMGIGLALPVVMSLLKKIGGPSKQELAGRKTEGSFEQSFGGFDGMMKAVGDAYAATGRSAQQAQDDVKALMDAEKHGSGAVQGMIDKINVALNQQKEVASGVDAIVAATSAAGGQIPKNLQPMVDKLLESKDLTDTERTALQGLLEASKPNYAKLEQMASTYGITLAGLGPKFEQAHIDASAKQIFADFTALTDAGADVGGVLSGMSDEISKLVQDSVKFGTAIPDNMKPLIQNLMDAGKLTDASGGKLTDISKINFEATPLDKSTNAIVDAINKLGEVLAGLPDVANRAADGMNSAFGRVRVPNPAPGRGAQTETYPSFDDRPLERVTAAGFAMLHPGDVVGVPQKGQFGGGHADFGPMLESQHRILAALEALPDHFGRKVRDGIQMAG